MVCVRHKTFFWTDAYATKFEEKVHEFVCEIYNVITFVAKIYTYI